MRRARALRATAALAYAFLYAPILVLVLFSFNAARLGSQWHGFTLAWYEKALANPNRISPDLLAKSGRKAKVVGAGEKMVLRDGTRAVEIHHIQGSVHAAPFLMVYLPKERLLIEGDAYTPLAPNAAPPSPPNANNVNLVQNIERLKLSVERILPLHGRIVPMSELNRAIGR